MRSNFFPSPPKAVPRAFWGKRRKAMYTVFVLKSLKSGKRYVGITSQDVSDRLKEHNQGSTQWTRQHRPFKLVSTEEFEDKTRALRREKFLKTGDGFRVLSLKLNQKPFFSPKQRGGEKIASQFFPK